MSLKPGGHPALAVLLALVLVVGWGPPVAADLGGEPPPAPALSIQGRWAGGGDTADATVSESTGAARLRIPIDLPPGPGGFQPQLALGYSSQAGDGPLGVGWGLHLGEIRCTARFGVPDYANCPQFELDGELLVGPDANGHYHTFVESFRRIRLVGPFGGAWEVTLPDGTMLRYGIDGNSRVMAGGQIARWLLAEMWDPHGNSIGISYDRSDPGTAYLDEIAYADGQRVVHFVPESRPDPIHDYQGGIERRVTKRLREIQVLSNGGVFSRRVLGYASSGYATERSRLAWTQLFGTDCTDTTTDPVEDNCTGLPAQQFQYTDPSDVLGAPGSHWAGASEANWEPPFDFVTQPTVEKPPGYDLGVRFGDVNGDGREDMVRALCTLADYPCDSDAKGTREVWLNTGAGWVKDDDWSEALRTLPYDAPTLTVSFLPGSPTICDVVPGTVPRRVAFQLDRDVTWGLSPLQPRTFEALPRWQLVDLDGDGLADLVNSVRVGGALSRVDCNGTPRPPPYVEAQWGGWVYLPGAESRIVYRNTGTTWVRDPALEQDLPIFAAVTVLKHRDDGEPDGLWYYPSGCRVWGAWEGYWDPEVCLGYIPFRPEFVDLNGDGRKDLVVLDPELPWMGVIQDFYDWKWLDENHARSAVWLQAEDGSGWRRTADLPFQHASTQVYGNTVTYGGGVRELDTGVRFVDLNRDGLTDVLWTDPFLLNVTPPPPLAPAVRHPYAPTDARGILLNTGRWCTSPGPGPAPRRRAKAGVARTTQGPARANGIDIFPPSTSRL